MGDGHCRLLCGLVGDVMIREFIKDAIAVTGLAVMLYALFFFALALDAPDLSALNAPDPIERVE